MQNYTGNRQNGMSGEDPVFRSLEVIEERIREKLTVQKLADSVHFSKYHYQRLFREAVGDSVMGYVIRRRLSLAAAELAETDASVLEIALKYGYDSHEGFTRSFKAFSGITPTEYRKYRLSAGAPGRGRERSAVIYSKTTDEIIRELNSLIVQAGEAAAFTRRMLNTNSEAAAFYIQFWDSIAAGTEAMAEKLTDNLNRVTAIAGRPDGISARFVILKAVEDTAFQTGLTVFQAGLTMARAKPEHREIFGEIYEKYETLARNARIKTARITEFMRELSALIFRDMRETAEGRLREAVEKGMAAARELSGNPALPYGYIADEIREIAEELSAMPLESVTVSRLEDCLFRLDIVAFAADVDALRAPSHRQMLDGIPAFREQISETVQFFQSLPTGEKSLSGPAADGKYGAPAFWGKILLFYLKGEIQKLGDAHLDGEQKASLDATCGKMNAALHMMEQAVNEASEGPMERAVNEASEGPMERAVNEATERLAEQQLNKPTEQTACAAEIAEILREIYDEMSRQAEKLGICGAPIQYIAEEVKSLISSFE